MSKIDEALHFSTLDLEDAPTADALAEDIRRAVHNIEHQPLQADARGSLRYSGFTSPLRLDMIGREESPTALPAWIPSNEEVQAVRDDLERRIFEVFDVSQSLIIAPRVSPWININITFTITDLPFEEKLAALDRAADAEPVSSFDVDLEDLEWEASGFELELEQLDYQDNPDVEPEVGTFEWKLWALDHGITVGTSEPHEIIHGQWHGDDYEG